MVYFCSYQITINKEKGMITKPVRIEKEIIEKAHTVTDRYVIIKSKINNDNEGNKSR